MKGGTNNRQLVEKVEYFVIFKVGEKSAKIIEFLLNYYTKKILNSLINTSFNDKLCKMRKYA